MWLSRTLSVFDEQTLKQLLNNLSRSRFEVKFIIPHRLGQQVGVDVVYTNKVAPSQEWDVVRAGSYGDELAAELNRLERGGWEIFEIIPHRIRSVNFPEVIARRPSTSAEP